MSNVFFYLIFANNVLQLYYLRYLNYAYRQQVSSKVHESVIVSKTDVLREVRKLLFTVGQIGGVVNENNSGILLASPSLRGLLQSDILGFLDNPSIEV